MLLTKSGRKQIGSISLCPHWTRAGLCYKAQGDFRRLKGGILLTASAWAWMIRVHPQPPYFFEKDGDGIKPESATTVSEKWGMDRAAGE